MNRKEVLKARKGRAIMMFYLIDSGVHRDFIGDEEAFTIPEAISCLLARAKELGVSEEDLMKYKGESK